MCVTNRMHIISLIRILYENSNSNRRTQTDYMYMYIFNSKAYIAVTLCERNVGKFTMKLHLTFMKEKN